MIIAIRSEQEVVTCSSCKHCYVSLSNLLLGGRQFAKCKRTEKSAMTYDPVTGKTFKKVDIDYCSTERGDFKGIRGECGPKGQHWVPKKTRDVFEALKRF
jgi:hypothetical protein